MESIKAMNVLRLISSYLQTTKCKFEWLKKALQGAHIVLNDNGSIYKQVMNLFGSDNVRYSSHYKNKSKQYFVNFQLGKIFIHILLGHTDDGNTFFQFERSPWNNKNVLVNLFTHPLMTLSHTKDFLNHKASKQNVGPTGKSSHTESSPLVC